MGTGTYNRTCTQKKIVFVVWSLINMIFPMDWKMTTAYCSSQKDRPKRRDMARPKRFTFLVLAVVVNLKASENGKSVGLLHFPGEAGVKSLSIVTDICNAHVSAKRPRSIPGMA